MLNLILPKSYAKEIDQSRLATAFLEGTKVLGLAKSTSLTLRITNNRVIRQFNHAWRGENSPTDVLSFENAFTDPETGEEYLGDIVISFEKARQQAQVGGHSIQSEIELLFVHGLLHLAGFDHDQKEQWAEMTKTQDQILRKIGNPLQGGIQYNPE
ncbi:MAG TPA: rRNA maturation RNase YbeY [Anaerolineaceae bacterium]|jgi:probable rRNA maturation factor|nr:rRNA maturation RNase YbeY [Anaerolineaceae bacterium]